MIVLAKAEDVTPLWDQCVPLIAPIIATRPTHDAEDIRLALLDRRCHLWVQWDDGRVLACAITEMAAYPRGAWLRVWMMGAAKGAETDYDGFYEALNKWRLIQHCRGFECIGRHGWMRKFKDARPVGIVLRVTLDYESV